MTDTAYLRLLISVFIVGTCLWQLGGAARTFKIVPEEGVKRKVSLMWVSFMLTFIQASRAPINSRRWMIPIGLGVLVGAVALFEWARHAVKGMFFSYIYSDDTPQFLCTTGPYAYIRNPFYSSYLLTFLGSAILVPNWITIGVFAGTVLFLTRATQHEERKFMRSGMTAEYEEFLRKTGRFLPRL